MVNEIQVKSILNKHKKRDDWFLDDYSVNPYEGCSFNCIYCYIRGSKYGESMAKTLSVKVNSPELLEKELSRRARKGEYGIIALSSSTEPYMPIEEKLKLTRKLLEIILKYKFPVHVLTKSKLVLRDLNLLKELIRMQFYLLT
ncbi:radical SAM protein [Thermofilum sp.]|jgi:DNA repair photolyase|uniref:SPL family radical SAM protein n=1 Tax=Thermofilum sp. TaxID=1961369 RepID=UPI002585656F|nr:radical SAM protein [Thermofilum sp.]